MKPNITFECTNKECKVFGKIIPLKYFSFFGSMKDDSKEDYWTAKLKHCRKCFKTGNVQIQHGKRNFSELETFEEYIVGLAKEAKLLKKLVDRGVAEKDEKKQFDKLMQLLSDAECPCCGQPLLETVETEKDN